MQIYTHPSHAVNALAPINYVVVVVVVVVVVAAVIGFGRVGLQSLQVQIPAIYRACGKSMQRTCSLL